MKAKLLDIQSRPSKYGGEFCYLFFKGEDGKSYRSCVSPSYRNWENWQKIVSNFSKESPVWLNNLFTKNGLIDADSKPTIIEDYKEEEDGQESK